MRFKFPEATLWRAARRLKGDRSGTAAVEFALVAPVFFALLFAILETALVFFAGQLLETATQDSARLIMTGQAQGANYSQAQFKSAVCSRLSTIFDCTNGVYVDVQCFATFGAASMTPPIDNNKNFVTTTVYCPGTANTGPGSSSIVIVRVYYQWQLWVTGLGYNIANLSNNKRLLVGTAAFRNEPYT